MSWAVAVMLWRWWKRGGHFAVRLPAVSPLAGAWAEGEGSWGQGTAPQHQTGKPHLPAASHTLLGGKRETMEKERS